ncbi:hypothetical protein [Nocardia terpenica]|uniref:MarR family transcriptional regulator n=1 Tax=Nocardia terpenica TaxID=455432 RepID=A0A6G9Z769_9NOCA|nr:hypothetical protein [Nocardia terpenica]QIS21241.1 hypothetical protein F6W96_25870 [Nocardia terpenica]
MSRPRVVLGYTPAQQRNLHRLAEAGTAGLAMSVLAADESGRPLKGATGSSLKSLERQSLVEKQVGDETVWVITEKGRTVSEKIQARRAMHEQSASA